MTRHFDPSPLVAQHQAASKTPSNDDRLALRSRPAGPCVGRQRWNHLLFAHWEVESAAVQATLPPGLFVDTFEGKAYLGIVPFFMQRVRPSWLPPLPWISWFLELNVRTYVHDADGRPGVWFYSLDCNQPIAVALARRFFHLPYQHARMSALVDDNQLTFECERRRAPEVPSRYVWQPGRDGREAAPRTLEFFLVERYLLFAADQRGTLYSGQVHHRPYRIHRPHVSACSVTPARQAGFALNGEPVSLLTADAVDVSIFPLRRASRGS